MNSTSQHVLNEDHQSNTGNKATQAITSHEDEVINIQLPYDPQALTKPELWSSSFHPIVMNLFLRVGNKNNSCIRETQENSIEFQVQSSLPYILIPMVRANHCAPYPK